MSIQAVIPAMLLAVVCAANARAEQHEVESLPLFIQAKKADLKRYQFAVDKGATFHLTPDGKSFYLL
ncbi:MAG: hypothetical protein HY291_00815 [Planctomycetes bacterium]|nr:hypothetical protein [Planctomycetota bacterium]